MQLLSEVRNIIQQRDIDEFNELTIHKEIKSRKVRWMLTEKPFLHGKLSIIFMYICRKGTAWLIQIHLKKDPTQLCCVLNMQ